MAFGGGYLRRCNARMFVLRTEVCSTEQTFARFRVFSPLTVVAEEGADVFDEEVRFLEGGEVAAAGHFGPALDVVGAFGPLAGRAAEVAGEEGDGAGDVDTVIRAEVPRGALVFVVEAGGRVDSLGDPVNHNRVEQLILGVSALHVAVAVAPGAEFFHNPGAEAHRGVVEAVGKGLGLGALDVGIAAFRLLPLGALFQERSFLVVQGTGALSLVGDGLGDGGYVDSDDVPGVVVPQAAVTPAPQSPPWAAKRSYPSSSVISLAHSPAMWRVLTPRRRVWAENP